MTTKMHNPKTGETIRVPGRRVKDHLQNGYEIADGSEAPVGNVKPETGEDKVTKEELYEQAQELDIEGRSSMSKSELQTAIEEAEDAAEDEVTDDGGEVVESDYAAEPQAPAHLGEVSPDIQAENGTDLI